MEVFIGFDSAWANKPDAPGAICAVRMSEGRFEFHAPQLVSFTGALDFIKNVRAQDGYTIVAMDQPTIVPHQSSARFVDRVAGSVMSWIGGGVQSAYRDKADMFGDGAPIWSFIESLNAIEDPELSRVTSKGVHLIEVYPAFSLASLDERFFSRCGAPKYNPKNGKFRLEDWTSVSEVAAREARTFECEEMAQWCSERSKVRPRKSDQDMLDSVICVLVALRWRLRARAESLLLGDLKNGYMVVPICAGVRERLILGRKRVIAKTGFFVSIDGDHI